MALQQGVPRSGFSTDIVKAFNGLPRLPLMAVARQLGIPERVLRPWSSFVASLQRRFQIRREVSAPIFSTSGFPEGCPLSPVAMVLGGLIFHTYQKAFLPELHSLSYADNWSGCGSSALQVVKGLHATECVCDMLTLELDQAKTFTWSTGHQDRLVLRAGGFTVVEHAKELGGFLSFSARTRNSGLYQRCEELLPLFKKLGALKGL